VSSTASSSSNGINRAGVFIPSFVVLFAYTFDRIPIDTRLSYLKSIFTGGPKAYVVLAAAQFALAIALFAYTSNQVSHSFKLEMKGLTWIPLPLKHIVTRVIISILTAVFTVLSGHFAYKLFDSIQNGSISRAVHEPLRQPDFAFRTWHEYVHHKHDPSMCQLPAFVKGLFVSIRAGRLFGRVRKAARDVRRKPTLLCNIFLWVFVFLLPLLIVVRGVVGLLTFMNLPGSVLKEPSEGDPNYWDWREETIWMSE
jgi:hypothetical protein